MGIQHKFLNYNWANGFYTENSILKNDIYLPEVLVIGTFNHGWPWNPADFSYGRGMYMWTNLANLFLHNKNEITRKRTSNIENPTIDQIFEICKIGKIAFADIIKGTTKNIPTRIEGRSVLVDNEYSWSSYKDSPLNLMGNRGWLEDNVDDICAYVVENPSIKEIYFTFKSAGNWIDGKKKHISLNVNGIKSCSIFTPTGNGFGANYNFPYEKRPWSITHHWVWNGLKHDYPINNTGYGHLNHDWLIRNGVDPNNF